MVRIPIAIRAVIGFVVGVTTSLQKQRPDVQTELWHTRPRPAWLNAVSTPTASPSANHCGVNRLPTMVSAVSPERYPHQAD